MRIAFVVPGYAAEEADPCLPVVVDVLSELRERADVLVLALRYPPGPRRYTHRGIPVLTLGGGTRRGAARIPLLMSTIRVLLAEHRRQPFSVVHGLWADEPGTVAAASARLLRLPSVVSLMGGEMVSLRSIDYGGALSTINRRLTRYSFSAAGAVTAGCAQGGEAVAGATRPSDDNRVRRLPWGIDPSLFTAAGPRVELVGRYRILQVGSLTRVKGADMLLRAAALAARDVSGLHVHLAGEGPEREALLRLAASLGLKRQVSIHGYVPRERLGAYYRGADVLAVASRHEMQPAVALEAASCGLPIVGTAVGLLPDMAPRCAVTVPVGDAQALGGALVRLAGGEELKRMRAAGPTLVRAEYLAEHTAGRLFDLYGELAGRSETATRAWRRERAAL